jgi:hypothetical protein
MRSLRTAILLGTCVVSLHAASVTVPVSSLAQPWLWDNTSLNTAFQFGIQDGAGPTIVDSSSGISFSPGNILTITYIRGLTSAFGGSPVVDGEGYGPNPPSPFEFDANNNPGSSGQPFPSFYMDPLTYPIYLNTLVGTFADAGGNIVGTPFAIFNGPLSVAVPVGAVQLQLGINDDVFADNTGELEVNVADAAVPEPGTMLLLGSAAVMAGLFKFRKPVR